MQRTEPRGGALIANRGKKAQDGGRKAKVRKRGYPVMGGRVDERVVTLCESWPYEVQRIK